MSVARVSALAIPVVLGLAGLASAGPVLGAACDGAATSLGNGSFETPVVAADTYSLLPAAEVPPWQTTDGLGEIELWGTGFLGVPALAGNAFAELNANTTGTLYQDVISTPGSTLTWTLGHRAREGVDTMVVLIGDANTADVNGSAGWGYTSTDLTDGVQAWGAHTDSFLVPAGQTCTRLAFRAVSTGSGNDSVGNFLDAVDFVVTTPAPPTATPDPGDPAPVVTAPPTDRAAPATPAADGAGLTVGALLAAAAGLSLALRRLDGRIRRGS